MTHRDVAKHLRPTQTQWGRICESIPERMTLETHAEPR